MATTKKMMTDDFQSFSQKFQVKRHRVGFIRLIDKMVEFFTGRPVTVVDEIEVVFLFNGDVEPDVILSGLMILETKSVAKTMETW